ncbi:MAG: zinc ribbon domain-containing protein [Caldimonas sp.]
MPIYAYRCENCGHAKDALQKLSDPVLTVCPACGEPTLRKQVTAAGFKLKGSGWYVTDFRGDKNAPGQAAEGASEGAKAEGSGASNGDAAAQNGTAPKGDSTSTSESGAKSASAEKGESSAKREKGAKGEKAAPAPAPAPAAAPAPAPAAPSGGKP